MRTHDSVVMDVVFEGGCCVGQLGSEVVYDSASASNDLCFGAKVSSLKGQTDEK